MDQFRSVVVLLLAAAAGLSLAFGAAVEGAAIVAVLLVNAVIGFVTELRAVRSMEALRRLGDVQTRVRRGGRSRVVPASGLVPGDVVLVEGGDVVTADVRLVKASRLRANESALTGESVPVDKSPEAVEEDVPLAERSDVLFKGTSVTRGSGEGVVVATGMGTELGRISALVAEAGEERTPLEVRLDRLARRLVWVVMVLAAFVGVAGAAAGRDLFLIVETSIALAVAAIPEGLPIIATIALARGMWRMADQNALINRLSAVETLGSTDVILTDKTGTLTENRMAVTRLFVDPGEVEVDGDDFLRDGTEVEPGGTVLGDALLAGVLCNDASLRDDESPRGGRPATQWTQHCWQSGRRPGSTGSRSWQTSRR